LPNVPLGTDYDERNDKQVEQVAETLKSYKAGHKMAFSAC
jgi:hypothetical protein